MLEIKIEEQTRDLEAARERNEHLCFKQQKLQEENEELIQKFNVEHAAYLEKQNTFIKILNDYTHQKRATAKINNELKIAYKNLEELEATLNNVKKQTNDFEPINDENLMFKTNVIDCLEKKLTEMRLKLAENEPIINELRRDHYFHENDYKLLKMKVQESISDFQQELIASNLRLNKVLKEFTTIRKTITHLKNEIQSVTSDEPEQNYNSFHINFNLSFNKEKKIKEQIDLSNNTNINLKNEVEYRKFQISNLKNQQAFLEEKLKLNEKVKEDLKSITRSRDVRYMETMDKITEISQKSEQLHEKHIEIFKEIQIKEMKNSSTIKTLQAKLTALQSVSLDQQPTAILKECTEDLLSEEIKQLTNKISSLQAM